MKRLCTAFLPGLILVVLFSSSSPLQAQSEANRLSFGFNGGIVKYWGEFRDNQFWLSSELFLRYNIIPEISVHLSAGLSQIRYKLTDERLREYPDYFGEDAVINGFYPNTQIVIEEKNATRLLIYEGLVSYNIFPHERLVPYLFSGVSIVDFNPTNLVLNQALPNNAGGQYDKQKVMIPFGIGFESYITDNLVINGRGTFRLSGTDFLDDFAEEGSSDDAFLTFGVGLSYYIFGESDTDGDGLTNTYEREIGTDPQNPDTDGDGLMDGPEVRSHRTDPKKVDSDGDNLSDYAEVTDHDTDPNNDDSDTDGLKDGEEITRKTDPNDSDSDDDSLFDGEEVTEYKTEPLKSDTDGDGLSDGDEAKRHRSDPLALDSDGDGLGDGEEVNVHKTSPANADTDNDGLKDGNEVKQFKTDPNNPDSDEDKLSDGEEVGKYKTDPLQQDTDFDSLSDGDEVTRFKTNPNRPDSDGDGLTDASEVQQYKTDPLKKDSDDDGLLDGEEINKHKTDPLNRDSDDDRLVDGDETLKYNTDPMQKDSDADSLSDGDEALKYKTDPAVADTDGDKLIDGVEVSEEYRTDPLKPDTDGDTIIDSEDACPLVAGKANKKDPSKHGCPQEAPKVGTKVDFPDILFIVNTDDFNFDVPQTAANLAKLLAYMNQCEGLQVMVEGHASSEGQKKRNQELSELRAKKVREWLLEQGIAASKIGGAVGYGSSQPKVKEPTPAEAKKMKKDEVESIRRQNRRITIKIMKTCDSK